MRERDALHHVCLIPGLFGFAQLAGYDYFGYFEQALSERFEAAGVPLRVHLPPAPPTASISVRAQVVARTLASAADGDGPIHLVGHSTGGLDARLLLSPGSRLPLSPHELEWRRRVRTLVAINTPHYGTPLAGYFTTVAGTRLLYALSLLTVTSLSIGRLPLTLLSAMLAAVGGAERRLQLQVRLLDELTAQVLRFVDARGQREIKDYLQHVRGDQGGIVQLMPEVMELFNHAVGDHPDVRYGCIASAGPAPGARRVFSALISPIGALQLAVYSTVYAVASRASSRYTYAVPDSEQAVSLFAGLGDVRQDAVDGIVPTLSMLWGRLLWCGPADHLDIVGHFGDDQLPRRHVDWLASGAHFTRQSFARMTDALCAFLLGE